MTLKKLCWALLLLIIGSAPALAGPSPWENSYMLQKHGKYLAALQALDAVPDNGPEAAFKTLRVGWLQYLMGHYDASLATYRKAAKADPQSLDALLGQTLPLLAQQQYAQAAKGADAALAIAPNNYTAMLRLAQAREGQKDWVDMQHTAAALASHYPAEAAGFLYLARAYAWQGHSRRAAAAYRALLVRDPGAREALSYLASAAAK